MNICVYGASSAKIDKEYTKSGEILGRVLASRGHTLIFGGGQNGLMGAVARGAKEKGGKIIGVAPSFFNVDGVLFDGCTEFIYTETMRERKQTMEALADAFIMTPGGIGTFEEFFEILTLKQLGRHEKPIAVLNTNDYFNALLEQLEDSVDEDFMTAATLSLFSVSDTPEGVISAIENDGGVSGSVADFKILNN